MRLQIATQKLGIERDHPSPSPNQHKNRSENQGGLTGGCRC